MGQAKIKKDLIINRIERRIQENMARTGECPNALYIGKVEAQELASSTFEHGRLTPAEGNQVHGGIFLSKITKKNLKIWVMGSIKSHVDVGTIQ